MNLPVPEVMLLPWLYPWVYPWPLLCPVVLPPRPAQASFAFSPRVLSSP